MFRRFAAAGALAALAGSAALAGGAPARTTAAPAGPPGGVSGSFSLVMMVHTSTGGFGNLPGVNPWNGTYAPASGLVYRSIPCTGNAPINNIASDLPSYGTRVAGSRAPSSMRAHPFGFRVRKYKGRWEMLGSIRFTVCQLGGGPNAASDPVPDAEKPQIVVGFRAPFKRETNESVRWGGRFTITGGTQRYADLKGSGDIAGYFMCFAPAGCAATGGNYLDGQFTMQGTYRDPTPQLAAG
jgi:hypothetical protein